LSSSYEENYSNLFVRNIQSPRYVLLFSRATKGIILLEH